MNKKILMLLPLGLAIAAFPYLPVRLPMEHSTPIYRLAKVERGGLVSTVAATGTVNAVATVLVGTQVSGLVKEIVADFNTPVKTGDILARIDPLSYQNAVDQAEAAVATARANVIVARANKDKATAEVEIAGAGLDAANAQTAKAQAGLREATADAARKSKLVAMGYGSVAEGERVQAIKEGSIAQTKTAEAQEKAKATAIAAAEAAMRLAGGQVETALANLQEKEAALKQARTDLERTNIRAPVDGIVIQRAVEMGQTVAAATLQAPTLYTVAQDLRDMQVNLSIDEADVGRIQLGQKVSFTVDTFPGRTFSATVSQIRKYPVVTQNVTTYVVIAAAANPDLALLPGLTANAKVILAERTNVLKVSNAALRFRPKGASYSGPAVWASGPDRPAERYVKLGIADGALTEITDGLKEGESVIAGAEVPVAAAPSVVGNITEMKPPLLAFVKVSKTYMLGDMAVPAVHDIRLIAVVRKMGARGTLYQAIRDLENRGKISRVTAIHMHTIKQIRNNVEYESAEVTSDDARTCATALVTILKTISRSKSVTIPDVP